MRLTHFFLWAFVTTYVAAGGLRAGYEKIFLYYAWKIDQTNPEDRRTLGIKCAEVISDKLGGCKDIPPPTDPNEPQKPKYIPCQYTDKTYDRVLCRLVVTQKPCVTLRDFLSHIDDKDWSMAVPIPGNQRDQAIVAPEIDATAMNMNKRDMEANRYPAWRIIKDGTSFNRMIEDVGEVVYNRKTSMTAAEYAANKQFFDRAVQAMEGIKMQRMADHHDWLLPKLRTALPDVDVKADEVVTNAQGKKLGALNFQKTIDDNAAKVPDVRDKMETWLQNHYAAEKEAREHKLVMDSFEASMNRIKGACWSTL